MALKSEIRHRNKHKYNMPQNAKQYVIHYTPQVFGHPQRGSDHAFITYM